jgi:hypothetical protein
MEHEKIFFSQSVRKEDLKKFRVMKKEEFDFLGEKFIFIIIGSSHFIYCEKLKFFEVFSSKEFKGRKKEEFDLKNGSKQKQKIIYENKFLKTKTKIRINIKEKEKKKKDYKEGRYDLFYEFKNGAITGIKIKKKSFKTIHTYPEHRKHVYSKTRFFLK